MEVRRGDGSVIAVEVAGEPGGRPVLFCHGPADSRLSVHPFAPAARELGVRLIAPRSPGIGGAARRLGGRPLRCGVRGPAARPRPSPDARLSAGTARMAYPRDGIWATVPQ
jgi:pimeloyl-ACP methyl ester carboxylesterase